MDKTCKLSGNQQVAIFAGSSGERVRNTWATCPKVGNNSSKDELMPNVIMMEHFVMIKAGDRKAWRFRMDPRPIS